MAATCFLMEYILQLMEDILVLTDLDLGLRCFINLKLMYINSGGYLYFMVYFGWFGFMPYGRTRIGHTCTDFLLALLHFGIYPLGHSFPWLLLWYWSSLGLKLGCEDSPAIKDVGRFKWFQIGWFLIFDIYIVANDTNDKTRNIRPIGIAQCSKRSE